MDPKFWIDRWQRADTGFHQKTVHDLLARHWPSLGLKRGAQVFVPLCGKSLDMVWLADEGMNVLGIELSELAVDSFFSERARAPGVETAGVHKIKRAGPYELWAGDFFSMPAEATRRISAVFDRASLVAMPRTMQQAYADKMAALVPSGVPVLLVSLDFDPSQMEGPPFPVPAAQVERLFGGAFRITRLEARDGLPMSQNLAKRGLTALEESVYRMVRR